MNGTVVCGTASHPCPEGGGPRRARRPRRSLTLSGFWHTQAIRVEKAMQPRLFAQSNQPTPLPPVGAANPAAALLAFQATQASALNKPAMPEFSASPARRTRVQRTAEARGARMRCASLARRSPPVATDRRAPDRASVRWPRRCHLARRPRRPRQTGQRRSRCSTGRARIRVIAGRWPPRVLLPPNGTNRARAPRRGTVTGRSFGAHAARQSRFA